MERWVRILIATGVGVSAVLSVIQVLAIARDPGAFDFWQFQAAGAKVFAGGLYTETADYGYRWSPVLAYALGPITSFGIVAWRIGQLALALTMPSRRLSLLVLVAWPFWFDVSLGNLNVLVLWLAAWALSGSRPATIGYLALAVLIPRPLVMPLAVWFLWREPWTRLPFAAVFGGHAALVVMSGWGPAWLERLVASSAEMGSAFNLGPSRLVGALWLPVGAALALWAFLRGRPALAGLFLAPYWLPYYFLLPMAELARPVGLDGTRAEGRVVRVGDVLPDDVDGGVGVVRRVRPHLIPRRASRELRS